jgi:hypothetical protein
METANTARRNYSAIGFVVQHETHYKSMWNIIGFEWRSLLLNAAIASTIGSSKQRELSPDFTITEQQFDALLQPLTGMGWYDGMAINPQRHAALLMQGLSYPGMVAMVRKVTMDLWAAPNLHFDAVYGLAGQRARRDTLDGTVAEIYDSLSHHVRAHPWVMNQMQLMNEPDCLEPFKGAFGNEHALFTLAVIVASNGKTQLLETVMADDSLSFNDDNIPARDIERYVLTFGWSPITIIHAPAERRARGKARGTSKNNVKYLLEHYGGVRSGQRLVICASRVGTARIMATSEVMLHSINNTIEVIGYADPPEGSKRDHLVALVNESANMLMKAAEEELNTHLPRGAKPLNSRDVKLIFERLLADDSDQQVEQIYAEIRANTIPRA